MKKFHQANLDETFICSKVGFSGRLLQVNIDSVILPNGRETTRELIHHPGAVAIVPILDDGSIIFVKQYRYPVGTVMYEIPAGNLTRVKNRTYVLSGNCRKKPVIVRRNGKG